MTTSDIYRQMLQQTQPFGATAPFEQATDLEERLRRVREQETAPSYYEGFSAPSPFLSRDASYNPTAGKVQTDEKPQVMDDTTPDLGMTGLKAGGPKNVKLKMIEGESAFKKGTEVSSDFIINELSNIQLVSEDEFQPNLANVIGSAFTWGLIPIKAGTYRRLISEKEGYDGTHYREYQYAKIDSNAVAEAYRIIKGKDGSFSGSQGITQKRLVEEFNNSFEHEFKGIGPGKKREKVPVYRHFLVKPDSKEGYSPDFEIAVKPKAWNLGRSIKDLELEDFWFSDPTGVDVGPGKYMGQDLSEDFPVGPKKWLVDTLRGAGKNLQEIQTGTARGKKVFDWQMEDIPEEGTPDALDAGDVDTGLIPGGEVTGQGMMGGGEDEVERGLEKLDEQEKVVSEFFEASTDLDKVTEPKKMTLEEKRDERRRLLEQENFKAEPKKEVTEVQSAGGTFESVLKSIGIDTGPLGISQFDLPGFPEDLFNRDDYLIDVTTKERLPNNSFDRSTNAQYFQDQTGMRVDQNGEPEFFVIETTTQESNPEIEAALEAYALALRANTDLSGSVAQVISAQINATEGMGIGAERLTPQELANLKRNVSLISASEGILTAPGQFEEELARQRLREISTGQRGQASAQLANIYSNPVAYGMVTSTPEGEQFLKDLQAQATYDPFSEMGMPARQADVAGQIAQQIDPLGPSYIPPAKGFGIGEDLESNLRQGAVEQMAPNINLTSGTTDIPAPAYNPLPSARRYEQEMTDIEKGRAQAEAAKRGIYGEEQLRKAIQTVTPLGYDFGGSAKGRLAPKTRKRSTMPDPWAGSVQMAGY